MPRLTMLPRRRAVMLAALLLAGPALACVRSRPAAPLPAAGGLVYACADGYRFSVRTRGDSAVLMLPERDLVLPRTLSPTGASWEGAGVAFRSRGAVADLTEGADTRRDCRASSASDPWDEARLRGIEFRAIGQEPGWVLELDAGHVLRFRSARDTAPRFAPLPEPVPGEEGHIRYVVADRDSMLVVTVRTAPCRDVMSGEAFTHETRVRTATEELRGCGRLLPTGDIAGRYWRLVDLDGAAVAGSVPNEPHLRFHVRENRFTGATGCNRLSGEYQRVGDRLRLVAPATTRMACTDRTAAALEQSLVQALERVDSFAVEGDVLRLYAGRTPVARLAAVPLR